MSELNSHLDDDLLPFYLNRSQPAEEMTRFEAHLSACPACQAKLSEWQVIAKEVRTDLSELARPPHSLSPLVSVGCKRRQPLIQALSSTASLIWAQRVFLLHGYFVPSVIVVILLCALVATACQRLGGQWAILPLFAVVPILGLLSAAMLYNLDDDPSFEILAAMPTSVGTLIYARLSFALGCLSLFASLGSLPLAWLGQASLLEIISTWLGPLLWLSALTTLLSLYLPARLAAGTALVAWGVILFQLASEIGGKPLVNLHLMSLTHPGWVLLAGEALVAGLLWLAAWVLLRGERPVQLSLERGS